MTLKELYNFGKKELENLDFPAFDCGCLTEKFFGANRKYILLNGNDEISPEKETEFRAAVAKRKANYPLQYILGYWYFADMKLAVQDGVLVPREDTEVLVDAAAKFIGDKKMSGIDLCSGTGAVALGIIQKCPRCSITAAEYYEIPLKCLNQNIKSYAGGRAVSEKLDVLKNSSIIKFKELDFVVSNPPYIESDEIAALQAEVQREPKEALDGGKSGLVFYEYIIGSWSAALKSGGLMAFEIGETQASAVSALFNENGFVNIQTIKDFAGLDRVVTAVKG
jgi:release factor glutamine methyltransferase